MPSLQRMGKDKVLNHHHEVPYRVLEHKYNFGDKKSGNMIIHGDNLEALKSLLPQYEGKVKCCYIDPPYNTGNEGRVYNDNVNHPKIKKWLNKIVGGEGDDLSRHDKWLCMMYPRLKLLHKLLAKDGAIFISIDDNEQANLRLMMDEIFGGGNFVTNLIREKSFSPINLKKTFSQNHDFIICYCKDSVFFEMNKLQRSDEANARYKNPDNDIRGPRTSGDLSVGPAVQENIYEIITPSGKSFLPPKGYSRRLNKTRLEEFIKDKRIWFGEKGNNTPRIKRFLTEVKDGITPMTIRKHIEVGHTQDAKKEIKSIFPESDIPFDTPKPVKLIERIIELCTNPGDIVLDSFAGSGTTAHVVLDLNKQDGENRKFILVELMDYAETITAERVRRVIKGYGDKTNKVEGTGGGFDYYTLGEALFDEEDNLNENIDVETIKQYIRYTETQTNYVPSSKKYLLGTFKKTEYYFYYEKDRATVLDLAFVGKLGATNNYSLIYADICLLSKSFLIKNNIIFKKIPRDITRF